MKRCNRTLNMPSPIHHRWILPVLTACSITVAGCAKAGSERIPPARSSYAMAIEESTSEQLLRNIVRTRFGATPVMLSMTQVLTQYEVTASGSAGATLQSGANAFPLSVTGTYRQIPTITYAPVTGQIFALRMLTPVQPWQLFLLHTSGWPLDRIFRLSVQDINGLKNLPTTPDASSSHLPRSVGDFHEACSLIGEMAANGELKVTMYQEYENKSEAVDFTRLEDVPIMGSEKLRQKGYGDVVYQFELEENRDDEDSTRRLDRFRSLLGLNEGINPIPLVESVSSTTYTSKNSIILKTRSVLSMMIALTDGIELVDELKGTYPGPYDSVDSGSVPDTTFPRQYFSVQSAKKKPLDAFVVIEADGTWYWIDRADSPTKGTFALLEYLMNFQDPTPSTQDAGVQLTLPTG